MADNFFGPEPSYHVARRHFVRSRRPPARPVLVPLRLPRFWPRRALTSIVRAALFGVSEKGSRLVTACCNAFADSLSGTVCATLAASRMSRRSPWSACTRTPVQGRHSGRHCLKPRARRPHHVCARSSSPIDVADPTGIGRTTWPSSFRCHRGHRAHVRHWPACSSGISLRLSPERQRTPTAVERVASYPTPSFRANLFL